MLRERRELDAPMDRYDPMQPPDASEWIELDEDERLGLVYEYHEDAGEECGDLYTHASFHVIVENQLAEGIPEVEATLERLLAEGLDRHDAIHAIGSVLAEHMYDLMHGKLPPGDPSAAYYRRLKEFSAAKWLDDR
jgi:hypothetical protein